MRHGETWLERNRSGSPSPSTSAATPPEASISGSRSSPEPAVASRKCPVPSFRKSFGCRFGTITSTNPSPSTSTRRMPGWWCVAGMHEVRRLDRVEASRAARRGRGPRPPRRGGARHAGWRRARSPRRRNAIASGRSEEDSEDFLRRRKRERSKTASRRYALGRIPAGPALQPEFDAHGEVRRGFSLKVDDPDGRGATSGARASPSVRQFSQRARQLPDSGSARARRRPLPSSLQRNLLFGPLFSLLLFPLKEISSERFDIDRRSERVVLERRHRPRTAAARRQGGGRQKQGASHTKAGA